MRSHARILSTAGATLLAFLAFTASALADYAPVGQFSGPGSADGELSEPQRAAVRQSTGELFVVDRGNDRVQVFSPSGETATYTAKFGAAQLNQPLGIAIDQSNGSIYVSDDNNVVKFTSSYAVAPGFTAPGVTGALAVDPSTGDLLIADRASKKVLRFNSDGTPDGAGFDGSTSGSAFTDPIDLAVNSAGDIYVVDQNGNISTQEGTSRVERFSSSGAHLATLTPVGAAQRPATVAVNPADDTVAVTGEQDAVYNNEAPTIHIFSAANAPLAEGRIPSIYSKVGGLAFAAANERLYVVTDVSDYPCICYGTPEVVVYGDLEPPAATIAPATDIAEFSATFNGEVDPNGSATAYRFEYSADGGENWTQTQTESLAETGEDPVPVSYPASGLPDDTALDVRLIALKGGGMIRRESGETSFSTLAAPDPVLTQSAPTEVGYFGATFHGTVDPEGLAVTARFEVSSDGGASWSSAGDVSPSPLEGTDPIEVSLEAGGLSASTPYLVRLVARDPGGTDFNSANESFQTLVIDPPALVLDPPSNVNLDSARLSGTVDAQDFDTTYRFEYSTDGGASWSAVEGEGQVSGTTSGPQSVSASLTVGPAGTYEIRLVASNPGGETIEGGQSFTIDSSPVSVLTRGANSPTDTSAQLTGYVNPRSNPATYYFEWGTQPNLSGAQSLPASEDAEAGSDNAWHLAAQDLKGLEPNTTYYYRLVAESSVGGAVEGEIRSFTTYPTPAPENQDCPNAEIRARQGSQHLPECRAYELVNNPDIGSGYALLGRLSDNGNRAYALIAGTAPESQGGGNVPPFTQFIAQRGPTGWTARSMEPVRVGSDYAALVTMGFSADLSRIVVTGQNAEDKPQTTTDTDVLRLDAASPGRFERLVDNRSMRVDGTSSDLDVIIAAAGPSQDSDSLPPFQHYEIGSGTPIPVNILPSGARATCGEGALASTAYGVQRNPISADGGRFLFRSPIGGDCFAEEPKGLYMRVAGPGSNYASSLATTVRLDEPAPGEPETGDAYVYQATPDGSRVFFVTSANLPGDLNGVRDLYRYETSTGERVCLTCMTTRPAVVDGAFAANTGDRAYFLSRRVLAPGAVSGAMNLYLLAGGGPRFVADVVAGSMGPDVLTPDGGKILFSADSDRLDALTGVDNGESGQFQIYRYDAVRDQITCLSCPAFGAASDSAQGPGLGGGVGKYRLMSDDGRTVAFQTATALVDSDNNGLRDVYRWREGSGVALITDGLDDDTPEFMGLTPDGSSILFKDPVALTPEVLSDTPNNQLYVARVNGGFRSIPVPEPCAGDSCHGAPTPPLKTDSPGSAQFSGPGNRVAKPRPRCAKGKVRKNGRCIKSDARKRRGAKQGKRAGANRGGGK